MQHLNVGLPVASLSSAIRSNSSDSSDTEIHRPVALLVFAEHAREIITSEVAIWLTQVEIQKRGAQSPKKGPRPRSLLPDPGSGSLMGDQV